MSILNLKYSELNDLCREIVFWANRRNWFYRDQYALKVAELSACALTCDGGPRPTNPVVRG